MTDLVSNVRISNYGDNVSDHLPVEIDLQVTISQVPPKAKNLPSYINWRNLSSESIDLFQQKITEALDAIVLPITDLVHGDTMFLYNA